MSGLITTLCSPEQRSCTRKMSPQIIRLVELTFGRPRRLWEIDSSLKECTQNLTGSRTQSRRSNLKGAWVTPTRWSWNLLKRQKAIGAHPYETDTCCSHFWEICHILPCGHWHWQAQFWNPPFSLLALEQATPPPTSLQALVLGCLRPSN